MAESYKVLIHIDESAKAKGDLVLRNIENLIADLGPGQIELVANYEAVTLFVRSPDLYGTKVRELASRGVRFRICTNAMRAFGITKEMLLPEFEIVPSALGELVKKQAEGWAYIKP